MEITTRAVRHDDPQQAVDAATQNIETEPQFAVVSAPSTTDAQRLRIALAERFPSTQFHIASSCVGSMTDAGPNVGAGSLSLCLFHDALGAYGSAAGSLDERLAGDAACELFEQATINANREGELPALVWLSASPGCEEAAVAALHDELGGQVPIYGGSSADNQIAGEWWVADSNTVHSQGILVSVLYPNATVLHAFHSSYVPTGASGRVTAADGRTIHTIEGRPAAEVYNQWTDGLFDEHMSGGNILAASTMMPLAVKVNAIGGLSYYRLLHPETITADGALTLFAQAEAGETLHLLRGDKASLLSRAGRVAVAAMDADARGTDGLIGGLVTYCAGCMLAVDDELDRIVDSLVTSMPEVPFIGQFTFGEQGTFPGGETCHGNLMISTVLFRTPR